MAKEVGQVRQMQFGINRVIAPAVKYFRLQPILRKIRGGLSLFCYVRLAAIMKDFPQELVDATIDTFDELYPNRRTAILCTILFRAINIRTAQQLQKFYRILLDGEMRLVPHVKALVIGLSDTESDNYVASSAAVLVLLNVLPSLERLALRPNEAIRQDCELPRILGSGLAALFTRTSFYSINLIHWVIRKHSGLLDALAQSGAMRSASFMSCSFHPTEWTTPPTPGATEIETTEFHNCNDFMGIAAYMGQAMKIGTLATDSYEALDSVAAVASIRAKKMELSSFYFGEEDFKFPNFVAWENIDSFHVSFSLSYGNLELILPIVQEWLGRCTLPPRQNFEFKLTVDVYVMGPDETFGWWNWTRGPRISMATFQIGAVLSRFHMPQDLKYTLRTGITPSEVAENLLWEL
ncbi:hypothetical protein C8R44DRAFT_754937 [Mycena epipterygia]|nr:hypothetical protein C8R44DRAFT_754937 [Mycena epipterygia]